MKFRATGTIIWDFDTDLSEREALLENKQKLQNVKIDNHKTSISLKIEKAKNSNEKIRLAEFDLNEILERVEIDKEKEVFEIDGQNFTVKLNSDRLRLFKNCRKCVSCGLEATRLFLETYKGENLAHFNAYGVYEDDLVLFTKDHIKAKSCGGKNILQNYQTMCSTCNTLKAHLNLDLESLFELRKIYDANVKKISKKQLHLLIEQERARLSKPWYQNKPDNETLLISDIILYKDKNTNQFMAGVKNEIVDDLNKIGELKAGDSVTPMLQMNDMIMFTKNKDHYWIHKSLLMTRKGAS